MKSVPTWFFTAGAVFALAGMIWGIQMAAQPSDPANVTKSVQSSQMAAHRPDAAPSLSCKRVSVAAATTAFLHMMVGNNLGSSPGLS
jgi:membrane protease subunit (stomatin/prohibitin family)